jgi:hypothetical protein
MAHMAQSRRRFLGTLTATGAAGLIGPPNSKAQDERLETKTVRIGKIAGICIVPQYVPTSYCAPRALPISAM